MEKRRFVVPILGTVIGASFVLGMTLLPEWGVINRGAESELGKIDAAKASVEANLERAKTETEKYVPELPTFAGSGSEIARASLEASLERSKASVELAKAFESITVPSDGKE